MIRGLAGPVVLIWLGGMFLVNNLLPRFDLGRWWPAVFVGIGLGLLLDRCCNRSSRKENS